MANFSVADGLKIAIRDIAHYAHFIADYNQRIKFVEIASELVSKSVETAKTGYDIKRGTEIESLYYKQVRGYTDAQYADHCRSFD